MLNRYSEYSVMHPDAKRELFKTATVVLDTNILLSLYRQSARGSEQLLEILAKIRDRLWIPDHVIWEFVKNRPNVIYGQDRSSDTLVDRLLETQNELQPKINEYFNRIK